MTHAAAVDELLRDPRYVAVCLWVAAKYRAHHDAYPTWVQLRQYLLDGGMTYDNVFVQELKRRARAGEPYRTGRLARGRKVVDGWRTY